jgi:uncharacterized YigZ family protein
MEAQEFFYTIEQSALAEFKDRGSRFLAYAFPMQTTDDFKKQLQALKKEHPKAAHHCFAYRLGLDGNNFRASDDGEPSGSAGRPILGQMDSKNITNAGVVEVRYFGGTLLGVPGLINAYKTATVLALQLVPIVRKPVLISYHLQFDYTLMNEIMLVVKQCQCAIEQQEISMFCTMKIGVPVAKIEEVIHKLKDIQGAEVEKI